MRRAGILLLGLAGVAACSPQPAAQDDDPRVVGTTDATPVSSAPASVAPPASPVPVADGKCSYLDSAFVADANGQRVTKVKLSADTPHPACFFYRADGRTQLTSQVYVGDAAHAKALVDQSAPVATADPATLPGGWTGGAQSSNTGAVFAVSKGPTAVVITTNQAQTIKAKRVAEQVIETLGL